MAPPSPALPPLDHLQTSLLTPLTCTICSSLYHDPVALLPCTHNFCGACIFTWFRERATCPICRVECTKAVAAHTVQAVVEVYLETFPEEGRVREARRRGR
ncbi:RING/U-box, partial [Ascobolus immersus RN42]